MDEAAVLRKRLHFAEQELERAQREAAAAELRASAWQQRSIRSPTSSPQAHSSPDRDRKLAEAVRTIEALKAGNAELVRQLNENSRGGLRGSASSQTSNEREFLQRALAVAEREKMELREQAVAYRARAKAAEEELSAAKETIALNDRQSQRMLAAFEDDRRQFSSLQNAAEAELASYKAEVAELRATLETNDLVRECETLRARNAFLENERRVAAVAAEEYQAEIKSWEAERSHLASYSHNLRLKLESSEQKVEARTAELDAVSAELERVKMQRHTQPSLIAAATPIPQSSNMQPLPPTAQYVGAEPPPVPFHVIRQIAARAEPVSDATTATGAGVAAAAQRLNQAGGAVERNPLTGGFDLEKLSSTPGQVPPRREPKGVAAPGAAGSPTVVKRYEKYVEQPRRARDDRHAQRHAAAAGDISHSHSAAPFERSNTAFGFANESSYESSDDGGGGGGGGGANVSLGGSPSGGQARNYATPGSSGSRINSGAGVGAGVSGGGGGGGDGGRDRGNGRVSAGGSGRNGARGGGGGGGRRTAGRRRHGIDYSTILTEPDDVDVLWVPGTPLGRVSSRAGSTQSERPLESSGGSQFRGGSRDNSGVRRGVGLPTLKLPTRGDSGSLESPNHSRAESVSSQLNSSRAPSRGNSVTDVRDGRGGMLGGTGGPADLGRGLGLVVDDMPSEGGWDTDGASSVGESEYEGGHNGGGNGGGGNGGGSVRHHRRGSTDSRTMPPRSTSSGHAIGSASSAGGSGGGGGGGGGGGNGGGPSHRIVDQLVAREMGKSPGGRSRAGSVGEWRRDSMLIDSPFDWDVDNDSVDGQYPSLANSGPPASGRRLDLVRSSQHRRSISTVTTLDTVSEVGDDGVRRTSRVELLKATLNNKPGRMSPLAEVATTNNANKNNNNDDRSTLGVSGEFEESEFAGSEIDESDYYDNEANESAIAEGIVFSSVEKTLFSDMEDAIQTVRRSFQDRLTTPLQPVDEESVEKEGWRARLETDPSVGPAPFAMLSEESEAVLKEAERDRLDVVQLHTPLDVSG